jgi:competence protein ComEA
MSDNSWDKDWLVFSRKARRGAFVLLFIFIAVAVVPRVYRNHFMDGPLPVQITSLIAQKEGRAESSFSKDSKNQITSVQDQNLESYSYNIPDNPFDPNTYSFEEWKAIGFSEKQVHTILNYQQSGGVFKVREDLKKLYVIDEELYLELYDVIDLPDTILSEENRELNKDKKTHEKTALTLNINKATLSELKEVSGIGPFFAEEIVKLREDYGGIHDLNQLLEIYRIDEEKLSTIKESLIVEKGDIKKLNINKATRKELNNHKEISWNVANSIVSMRETHGEYKKIDDLLKSILIDREKLETLKPYLTVE